MEGARQKRIRDNLNRSMAVDYEDVPEIQSFTIQERSVSYGVLYYLFVNGEHFAAELDELRIKKLLLAFYGDHFPGYLKEEYQTLSDIPEEELIRRGAEKLTVPEFGGRKIELFYWNYDTSVKTLGGYCEQAFYPDTYRLKRNAPEGEDASTGKEYEYYMAFDELTDLTGWYPLDRFIWEGDPEPLDAGDLRKIILDTIN